MLGEKKWFPISFSHFPYPFDSLKSSTGIHFNEVYMKRTCIALALAAIFTFSATDAAAWDDTGHKLTGYIAWQRLNPDVREKIFKILMSAPEDSNIAAMYTQYGSRSVDAKRREFFMLMTTWADMVRDSNFPVRFKNYHRSSWHYQNVFWETRSGKPVELSDMENSGQLVEKIEEFKRVLTSDVPPAEKALAIVWLEHLIGDIHQPLHASGRVTSANPKGDQGGNLFLLTPKGTPRDKQENLHWFWDSIVVRYSPNTADKCDADYIDPIAEQIMKDHPYEKLKAEAAEISSEKWLRESFAIASTEVYKGVEWFNSPSDKYKKKAYEIAEQRIALAGYRMAAVLTAAFADGPK